MWSFEIIPAPATQSVKPRVVEESLLDEYFPPVAINADGKNSCNCSSPSPFCLVSIMDNATENTPSVSSEDESPLASENDESPVASGEDNSCDDDTEYFTQNCAVKGLFWEGRYQEALRKHYLSVLFTLPLAYYVGCLCSPRCKRGAFCLLLSLLSLTKTVQSGCNIFVYVRRDRRGINIIVIIQVLVISQWN